MKLTKEQRERIDGELGALRLLRAKLLPITVEGIPVAKILEAQIVTLETLPGEAQTFDKDWASESERSAAMEAWRWVGLESNSKQPSHTWDSFIAGKK